MMESDLESVSDDEDQSKETTSKTKKKVVFSLAQKTHLNSLYYSGMRSISKEHSSLIAKAAEETQLTTAQIKVRITICHSVV